MVRVWVSSGLQLVGSRLRAGPHFRNNLCKQPSLALLLMYTNPAMTFVHYFIVIYFLNYCYSGAYVLIPCNRCFTNKVISKFMHI